jgi:hypothetical protein
MRALSKQMRTMLCHKSPYFIGTFAMRRNFVCAASLRKVFSQRTAPDIVLRWRCGGGARHLHTKLSGVTVIFFLL